MKPQKLVAALLLIVAFVLTGVGGLRDMLSSDYRITKEHAWNDASFLVLVAIAILLF
jgi:hypothetical protein